VAESRLVQFLSRILGPSGRKYESETTAFMRDFLAQHPEEVVSQRKGRGVWWDKDLRERTEPPPASNSPKSGGAEYTFKA
jgi:hypothetical protein